MRSADTPALCRYPV